MKKIILAVNFAAGKHRDQRRKDRESSPYINHPLALAFVLTNEVTDITDENVVVAAILHDTIEDTDTSTVEIAEQFGQVVLDIVMEVTDDKSLPKAMRKQVQIDHASQLSREAKLVKLADKICNLRDMANSPPFDWTLERQKEYFEWANAVVNGLRGAHPELEALFDNAYGLKPKA
jgi:guanosine-3',5'-bis(diphosphate) 3'-pyrophosphohydrolase